MNISQAFIYAANKFKLAKIESANIDARILLVHVLDKSIEYLLMYPEYILSESEYNNFLEVIEQRCLLKPIAYILRYKEFYGRKFTINEKILIPRSDTETLIDAVLSNCFIKAPKILELGVGSGCIIITLLSEIKDALGIGCDINDDALQYTINNARIHNVNERLEAIKSNWFENIQKQKFDIIVSNPPYIPLRDKDLMAPETLIFEPADALFANDSGFKAYKIIAQYSHHYLNKHGKLFLEVGFNQAQVVTEIFTLNGYSLKDQFKDIANHTRILCFKLCD
jgi:release factor glutamine methyltransferase